MAKSRREREKRKSKGRGWAEDQGSSFAAAYAVPDNLSIFKPKKGNNKLDVIEHKVKVFNPNADKGELAHSFVFYIHRDVGPDGKTVVCPKSKGEDERCPICEHQNRVFRNKGKDAAQPFRAKKRIAQVVRDRDDQEKGLQWFEHAFNKGYGEKLKDKLLTDDDGSYDNWSDAKDGKALKVFFKDEPTDDEGGKWLTVSSIDFIDRKPLPKELVKEAPSVDEVVLSGLKSYKELDKMFRGGMKKDDEEEDDTEDDSDLEEEDEDDEDEGGEGGDGEDESDDEDDEDAEDDGEDDEESGEDSDGDESDEGDEDVIEKGDTVSFKYKGKKKEGEVTKIDAKGKNKKDPLVSVEVEGQDKPAAVRMSELTKVESDEEEDDDDLDDDSDIEDEDDDLEDDEESDDEDDSDLESDDEDEEEDDSDLEDEEEDEKPAKKGGKKSKK